MNDQMSKELVEGYAAMAADEQHEREALEWSEALIGDIGEEQVRNE